MALRLLGSASQGLAGNPDILQALLDGVLISSTDGSWREYEIVPKVVVAEVVLHINARVDVLVSYP